MENVMKKRQFINAIRIKFRNMMDSVAVKLCICVTLIASLIYSFWPFFSNSFMESNELKVYTNIDLNLSENDNIQFTDAKKADVEILFDSNMDRYTVRVHNDKLNNYRSEILNIIWEQNLKSFMDMNSTLSADEIAKITNQNIEVVYDKNIPQMDNELYTKLMIAMFIVFFVILILVSRIGARVAYDKGNQITEVILTSISRERLFYAEIISNFFVVWISMLALILPMFIASLINNDTLVMDFSFFTIPILIKIFIHLSLCFLFILVLVIGLSSLSKRPEDSNASTIIIMIPLYISSYYAIVNMQLFDGILKFLNYIPMFSIFTLFAAIVNNQIGSLDFTFYIGIDIIFLIVEIYLIRKLYSNNISKN